MSEINQITTMRLPDGAEVAFVDWSDTPLWSSADFLGGSADTELDLFQYVSGEPVPHTTNITVGRTSSDADTNLATPGSMASTEEMLVYAIKPDIQEWTLTDEPLSDANSRQALAPNQPQPSRKRLAMAHAQLLLTLEVSQKFSHRASLGYYNPGFGAFGPAIYSGAAFAQPVTAATPGMPTQEAVRSLVIPIHIGGQEKYRVRIENTTGAALLIGLNEASPAVDVAGIMFTMRIFLDGLYKRPVS